MLMEGTVIVEVMVLFLHVKKGVQNLVSLYMVNNQSCR